MPDKGSSSRDKTKRSRAKGPARDKAPSTAKRSSAGKGTAQHPVQILLVDDDPGDVLITREALEGNALHHELHSVTDGEDALKFLLRNPPYENAPRPDLILLDLNMPRLDGRGVLTRLRDHKSLRTIPVVVLSTSNAEEDVVRSYSLDANAYVSKPVDYDDFVSVVRRIDEFFLSPDD